MFLHCLYTWIVCHCCLQLLLNATAFILLIFFQYFIISFSYKPFEALLYHGSKLIKKKLIHFEIRVELYQKNSSVIGLFNLMLYCTT